tara:strand:- start:617 stop:1588 length:972 start_codon:yes stop_codon:yes gene_type:complete
MKKILITGASGFIGRFLCKTLSTSGRSFRGAVRSIDSFSIDTKANYVSIGDINSKTNWKHALVNIDCIIHCAGRAHVMNEKKKNNLEIYRSINVHGTKQLAEQAAKAGVKRLIFLSSVKVIGEDSDNRYGDISPNKQKKYIFTPNDVPNPEDLYSVSKFEAETILWETAAITGLEVVVVRIPLVYGYGVKGNLMRLMKLINSGIPLPFSLIDNKRSLIGIDNLVDLLICCIDHPNAKEKTFLASDGEDLSTPELIKLIASSMGKKANLFPFPISMLKFLGSVFGKREEINRLVGSLRIDNSYTKEILNWIPPVSVEEGIKRMV